MSQMYWMAKSVIQQFNANGLAGTITNDQTQIADGAATDGRTVLTGADINVLISLAQGIVNQFEANSNLQLNQISKPAVNKR